MQILLDTSVVLDVLLRRAPWQAEASLVWQAVDEGHVMGCLTASTLTDIFYIVRRASNLQAAQDCVRLCLKTFAICTVNRAALEAAVDLSGADFEDNLQIACAMLAGLDAIVTRDQEGFRDSLVPVMTPAELLTSLNPQG
jgi:predicted nucleic acid-binding protein